MLTVLVLQIICNSAKRKDDSAAILLLNQFQSNADLWKVTDFLEIEVISSSC
jgi:hypothetical protein